MLNMRIEVNGEKEAGRLLRGMVGAIERPFAGDVQYEIAGAFYKIMQDQWSSQGSRGGSSWPALSEAYARRKAQARPGRPLLVYDGDLLDSVTNRNNQHAIFDATPTTLEFGTKDPKAATHQYGDTERGIPARPFAVLTDADADHWGRLVLRAILLEAGVRA